jgi:molybdopterin-guanine dinucleotide biosynthesis protein A
MYDPGMAPDSNVDAFILAGGKSTRMGTDKAFVDFEGRTLLERALDCARAVTTNVRIVGDPAKFADFAPVIEDIFPGCGPLAGIQAALQSTSADVSIILAVDLPFASPALLRFLIARAGQSPDCAAVVPRVDQRWQPLCAIYRRPFAVLAESALCVGHYKIDPLFSETKICGIEENELQKAGFPPRLFFNVNRPQDLADARH